MTTLNEPEELQRIATRVMTDREIENLTMLLARRKLGQLVLNSNPSPARAHTIESPEACHEFL